ncbi:MAG: DUF86 domain-containing protein [Albidovulum sp.]|nr:DUF86 domain-containing protein [Albidovulum sp.]
MKHDPRILLRHVGSAVTDKVQVIEGRTQRQYENDRPSQLAVERCFIAIGEVLNRLHRGSPELAGQIPKLRRIVDFRNLPVHGYDDVEAVWDNASNALPELLDKIRGMLVELDRRKEIGSRNDDDGSNPSAIPIPCKPPSPFD